MLSYYSQLINTKAMGCIFYDGRKSGQYEYGGVRKIGWGGNHSFKFDRKIGKRGNFDTANTQINDLSLSVLGIGTSIKSYEVNLFFLLWTQNSPITEMMRTCKCFPQKSKMPAITHNSGALCILFLFVVTQKMSHA